MSDSRICARWISTCRDSQWQDMTCPRGPHLPWGLSFADTPAASRVGGPPTILTDEGEVVVPVVKEGDAPAHQCPDCGQKFVSKSGLSRHRTMKHGK